MTRLLSALVVVSLGAIACGSDDGDATPIDSTIAIIGSSTVPAAASTTADARDFDTRAFVEELSSDEFGGRENGTEGSAAARRLIIDTLAEFAVPAYPDAVGDDRFLQPVDGGANVLAVIPGGDLAHEYVTIGAHYDHLGTDCRTIAADPDDTICNGAGDNATGVAATLAIARSLAADGPPRRTVVMGFWDREEDSFQGSLGYLADPVAPLDATIAYVNFDILATDLLPSLKNVTVMVGAETGGPTLVEAAREAAKSSTLDTLPLSLVFGQGRSDHAPFVAAGVPSVFFTDANNGCYHTTHDEADRLDFDKLEQQVRTAEALMRELSDTDTPPVFDAAAPVSSYDDAVSLLGVIGAAAADLDLLAEEEQTATAASIAALQAIVGAGPDAYDDAAVGTAASGVAAFVEAVSKVPCGT